MKKVVHIFELLIILLFCSLIPLWTETDLSVPVKIILTVFSSISYLWVVFRSEKIGVDDRRLKRLSRACSLIWLGGLSALFEIVILFLYIGRSSAGVLPKVFSVVMPLIAVGNVVFSGSLRASLSSKQIKLKDHLLMFAVWWCPIVNIFPLSRFYKISRREFIVESARIELENARAENEICKTKYPVLMVHGIFFRDWQIMNYWGRVPASLIRNGANVYYGHQQSAQSIKDSASELRDAIMKIRQETGAEKVNIIAHSKGGLDSRYAISKLGMDRYVATLTTINTPHRGCDMVDYLFDKLPNGIVKIVAEKYNQIFTVLGDTKPDFLSGVEDLRASRAENYDIEMPDSPLVSYRSRMSVMKSARSAGFPLNLGYTIIKKLNGENDGLVWEKSAQHGEYELVRNNKHRRGISHGDVIDLFRENIDGYDVREYYVGIVKKLKEEGF